MLKCEIYIVLLFSSIFTFIYYHYLTLNKTYHAETLHITSQHYFKVMTMKQLQLMKRGERPSTYQKIVLRFHNYFWSYDF